MFRGTKDSPHPGQTRSLGTFRPQCDSSVAAQLAHTIRRFSMRLSFDTPLMWSSTSDMRRPMPKLPLPAQLAPRIQKAADEQAPL
jgi:hypothetical protein